MNQRKLNVQQTEIGPGILARLNKWKPKKKKKESCFTSQKYTFKNLSFVVIMQNHE